MRDVRLAGVTLRTETVGTRTSPVCYVLHGGPGLDHTYLRPWLDGLSARASIVYVDLRGHGHSSNPPDSEGYTLESAADDLAALARARHDGTVDIVAHDFGAAVALSLAARHPEVVRRLVLIDPLRDARQLRAVSERSRQTLGDDGWQRVQRLTTPQGTLRDPASLPTLVRSLGAMWWHHPPRDETVQVMTRDMVYRPDADANFLVAASRWDARIAAASVRAPVLVISGDDDRTFLPEESQALAEALPHGHFARIAEAGHLPFIEANAAFTRVVLEFWRGP